MKRVFSLFLIISALIAFSCSDDATGPSGGGLGGGGNGGGGGVTFTVALVQDQQTQKYYFEFKPSTAVVVTSVTFNCAAAGVNNQQVPDDGTTVYTSTNPDYFEVVDPNILAQGQKWSFTIAGKLGSSTGTAYSVAANCDI
ncbi:MAG: hypothetical protein IPI19_15825 [Ignavibacteriales bacterium]|nr:hypothetical protein [Ignavibacteriales bacterium]MBP9120818.1 hypothetical protein [Ignavibacterium sp.]